jgi:hypothetical protein
MLELRRVELDTRYSNLSLFARDTGLDYRLVWDVEHAARSNYRRPTLTAIEVSYGWKPGSIARVLRGGEPEPGGDAGLRLPPVVTGNWDDENVRTLWGLSVSEDQRVSLIGAYLTRKGSEDAAAASR